MITSADEIIASPDFLGPIYVNILDFNILTVVEPHTSVVLKNI